MKTELESIEDVGKYVADPGTKPDQNDEGDENHEDENQSVLDQSLTFLQRSIPTDSSPMEKPVQHWRNHST